MDIYDFSIFDTHQSLINRLRLLFSFATVKDHFSLRLGPLDRTEVGTDGLIDERTDSPCVLRPGHHCQKQIIPFKEITMIIKIL